MSSRSNKGQRSKLGAIALIAIAFFVLASIPDLAHLAAHIIERTEHVSEFGKADVADIAVSKVSSEKCRFDLGLSAQKSLKSLLNRKLSSWGFPSINAYGSSPEQRVHQKHALNAHRARGPPIQIAV